MTTDTYTINLTGPRAQLDARGKSHIHRQDELELTRFPTRLIKTIKRVSYDFRNSDNYGLRPLLRVHVDWHSPPTAQMRDHPHHAQPRGADNRPAGRLQFNSMAVRHLHPGSPILGALDS